MRRFHRWVGLGSTVFILLAAITGLLWAYGPHLYWEGGYLERKHPAALADYDSITLTPQEAIRLARPSLGPEPIVSSVTLRSELGDPLYDVRGSKRGVLIDARSGAVLSPLSPEDATRIAAQYMRGRPTVLSTTLMDEFTHRSGKVHKSVYRIGFEAPKHPEIFLSAQDGAVLEEQDDLRRFHFWVMRLHQLNFFGFRKTLTILPGTAILLLIASGIFLSRRSGLRASAATSGSPTPLRTAD